MSKRDKVVQVPFFMLFIHYVYYSLIYYILKSDIHYNNNYNNLPIMTRYMLAVEIYELMKKSNNQTVSLIKCTVYLMSELIKKPKFDTNAGVELYYKQL